MLGQLFGGKQGTELQALVVASPAVDPRDDCGDDRVQPVALAQEVLLQQEQTGERSTDVTEPNQRQADVTGRPPGLFYACLTW